MICHTQPHFGQLHASGDWKVVFGITWKQFTQKLALLTPGSHFLYIFVHLSTEKCMKIKTVFFTFSFILSMPTRYWLPNLYATNWILILTFVQAGAQECRNYPQNRVFAISKVFAFFFLFFFWGGIKGGPSCNFRLKSKSKSVSGIKIFTTSLEKSQNQNQLVE